MLRRLSTKPRGLLRDGTLCTSLVLFEPVPLLATIGFVFFVLGVGLHFWSKGCLVRNWTLTATGPYRMVRHPFYLANFLLDDAICLFSGQWWLASAYIAAFCLVYLPTIRKEEKFLTERHGIPYLDYVACTPALIPWRFWKIFGPLDFAWENVVREKEISRIMRVLAIPMYFVIVAAVFHQLPQTPSQWMLVLILAIASTLFLNVASVIIRKKERRARWSLVPV